MGAPCVLDDQAPVLRAVGGEAVADVLEGIANDGRVRDAVEREPLTVEDVILDEDTVKAGDVEVAAGARVRVDDVDGGRPGAIRHVPLRAETGCRPRCCAG